MAFLTLKLPQILKTSSVLWLKAWGRELSSFSSLLSTSISVSYHSWAQEGWPALLSLPVYSYTVLKPYVQGRGACLLIC